MQAITREKVIVGVAIRPKEKKNLKYNLKWDSSSTQTPLFGLSLSSRFILLSSCSTFLSSRSTLVFTLLFSSSNCYLLFALLLSYLCYCFPLRLVALLFALLLSSSPCAIVLLFMSCQYSPFCATLLLSSLPCCFPLHVTLLLFSLCRIVSHCCFLFCVTLLFLSSHHIVVLLFMS